MPITIRRATINDMLAMQNANLTNLPENYTLKYYMYHLLSWPEASFVATTTDVDAANEVIDADHKDQANETATTQSLEDVFEDDVHGNECTIKLDAQYVNKGEKVIGYVLAKMNDDPDAADKTLNGHITSLSVMRTYRRMGVAEKLMRQALFALVEVFQAEYVSLHVRQSNQAALHLYRDTLEFEVLEIERGYYLDGEDAYSMKKVLDVAKMLPSKFQKANVEDDCESDLLQEITERAMSSGKLI
ncbi:N-terminal acetyltransferase A complex catalytic subunit ard1 [Hanseniaspora vineae]